MRPGTPDPECRIRKSQTMWDSVDLNHEDDMKNTYTVVLKASDLDRGRHHHGDHQGDGQERGSVDPNGGQRRRPGDARKHRT